MNRRISDLLDAYQDDRVELSTPTPLSSARIKELTMNKITGAKPAKKVGRFTIRLLAAAAVIAALTVSAMAVNYAIGAGGLMQGLFTRDGESLSTGQIEILDQIGHAFEEDAVTSNGATITPIAAVASESTCYIRLRIEAPEGVTLPDLDWDETGYYQLSGSQWPEEQMLLTFEVGDEVKGYSWDLEWQPDDDPTDNVKEVVIRYTSAGTEPARFNDGTAKFLTIRGLWIQSSHNEYTPVFTGEFVFEVGSRLQSENVHIDCGGVSHQVTDGYVNYLDTITLSPIDISYSFRTTLRSDNALGMFPSAPGELCVVMKDGTKHYVYDYMESNNPHRPTPGFDPDTMIADGPYGYLDSPYWTITEQFPFDEPLDLSQVDHILFDETYEFPVNPD